MDRLRVHYAAEHDIGLASNNENPRHNEKRL